VPAYYLKAVRAPADKRRDGIKGLVLSAIGNVMHSGQIGEKAFDLFGAGQFWRNVARRPDITTDPEYVRIFGLVLAADDLAHGFNGIG
jgi:hypothetical protein